MFTRISTLSLLAASGLLVACGGDDMADDTAAPAESGMAAEAPAEAEAAETPMALTLEDVIAGSQRPDADRARDQFRHPAETLGFFGIEPDMTVVEIWPGSGWYTQVIAPYLASGGGTYYAATFEAGDNENRQQFLENYRNGLSDESVYGDVRYSVLSPNAEGVAPEGSADMVLTFRNVHNWMSGGWADKAFEDMYAALKPGGILGVVEHRLPEDRETETGEAGGYVKESTVIAMAEAAGFQFVEGSEINANPADTADHPFGVWTLPPTLRAGNYGQEEDPEFDKEPYRAIGESDRMTLKFRKPAAADGAMLE